MVADRSFLIRCRQVLSDVVPDLTTDGVRNHHRQSIASLVAAEVAEEVSITNKNVFLVKQENFENSESQIVSLLKSIFILTQEEVLLLHTCACLSVCMYSITLFAGT